MSTGADPRWPVGEVCLGVAMPLLALSLSMDWFGHAGVGFGDVLEGADRAPMARAAGFVGYGACVPAFAVLLEQGTGPGTRRHRVAAWLALVCILLVLMGGLALAAGYRSTEPMRPGFPLFCCAAACMLIGTLSCWPPATDARP